MINNEEIIDNAKKFAIEKTERYFDLGVSYANEWLNKGWSNESIANALIHEHPSFIEGVNSVFSIRVPEIHFEESHNVIIYENGDFGGIFKRGED